MAVLVSSAWCDECLDHCFFGYDESTGRTTHYGSFPAARVHLEGTGHYYAGHHAGVFRFLPRRPAASLSNPSQMAIETQLEIHEAQYLDANIDLW